MAASSAISVRALERAIQPPSCDPGWSTNHLKCGIDEQEPTLPLSRMPAGLNGTFILPESFRVPMLPLIGSHQLWETRSAGLITRILIWLTWFWEDTPCAQGHTFLGWNIIQLKIQCSALVSEVHSAPPFLWIITSVSSDWCPQKCNTEFSNSLLGNFRALI